MVISKSTLLDRHIFELSRFGHLTSVMGRVAIMRVKPMMLPSLAKLNILERIENSRPMKIALDLSIPEIGGNAVWANISDSRGLPVDGSGVIIGIVDTGIDLTHPDFQFRNGTSKILYIWDQTADGRPPLGYDYGAEWRRIDIESERNIETDEHGHGTHIAGIAASSGLAIGRFQGVAPNASYIIVKSGHPTCNGTRWVFDAAEVVDGVHYIWSKARELGLRVVVNLSMGGNIGGHDNNSAFELALNELALRGLIIVVAAGNSADDHAHAVGKATSNTSTTIRWVLPRGARRVEVDLWHSGSITFLAKVRTPRGETVTGPTESLGVPSSSGIIRIFSQNMPNGGELWVGVESEEALDESGWSLDLTYGKVARPEWWDAWIESDSCSLETARFLPATGYTISSNGTVEIPGTASGVITVGAYVTKNTWITSTGTTVSYSGFPLHEIAFFSSRGPTRDGRTKPEVVAPGAFIASARTRESIGSPRDPDSYHTVMAGTSMAAPHVAGAIALLLQYDPSLSVEEVKRLLKQSSRQDDYTGMLDLGKGSNVWGWGKLDARTLVGMFRVWIKVLGLPSDLATEVFVDGSATGMLKSEEQEAFVFPRGTIHEISVNKYVIRSPLVRYRAEVPSIKVSEPGLLVFEYSIEYLLDTQAILMIVIPLAVIGIAFAIVLVSRKRWVTMNQYRGFLRY
jgi:subtilisin family serine protease